MLSLPIALILCAAPAWQGDDLTKESEQQLLQRIITSKNSTAGAVYEELGSRKSRASLNALRQGLEELDANQALKKACKAFRHFKAVSGLENAAVATLYATTQDSKKVRMRNGAYGLSFFPVAGREELMRIVDRSDDEITRANALAGLLPGFAAKGSKSDFKTTLRTMRTNPSLTRAKCLKGLAGFLESGGVKLFTGTLTDRKLPSQLRRLILDTLLASSDPDVNELLLDGLSADDENIVHLLMIGLAERGCDDYGKHLRRLTRSDDDAIRQEALVAQARLFGGDPTFFDKLLDQAEDRDPVLRSAAAISFGTIKTTDSLAALHELLSDPNYSVRFQALEATFAARHFSSIPHLMRRLERERGTLRPVLLGRLCLLTGEDFGNSTAMWKNWWSDHEEGFSIPPLKKAEKAAAERGARKEKNSTRASFYGLRIVSERLCFVIDNSNSMNAKTASGKTRLAAMQEQLSSTLQNLPDAILINLVFFAIKAEKWKDTLQVLNPETRTDAIREVMGLGMKGATVTYEGLMAGLEDPRVDTIYLLSDGQPYGGVMPNTGDILREIRRHNSVRHVVIHCISVGQDSGFLERLAEDNHGQYTRVD